MLLKTGFNRTYTWTVRGDIRYIGNIDHYNNEVTLQEIENIKSFDEFLEGIKRLRGEFSIIKKVSDNEFYLASDHTGSFPLFYNWECSVISDDCEWIRKQIKKVEMSGDNLGSWIASSYVLSGDTVFEGVYKCEAGQAVQIECVNRVIHKYNYYNHYCSSINTKSFEQLKNEFDSILNSVFKDLVSSIGDRPVVIPLSGGYDSRLIAAELKKLGYENVICYTYGLEGRGDEVEFSRKVAKTLGYRWLCVKYSKEEWDALLKSSEFEDYCSYASNDFVSPHIQEIIALRKLVKEKQIPDNCVVIPGFSADLPAGSYIFEKLMKINSREELLNYIFQKHFGLCLLKEEYSNKIRNKIATQLSNYLDNDVIDVEQVVKINDAWITQNRVTQYIINALRVYEFFGYQWRLPFWDTRFLDFFYRLGIKERIDCTFYIKYLFDGIFEEEKIAFKKPNHIVVRNPADSKVKKKLLTVYDYLITFLSIKKGMFVLERNNINNFNYASHALYRELGEKRIVNTKYKGVMQLITLYFCEKRYGAEIIRKIQE